MSEASERFEQLQRLLDEEVRAGRASAEMVAEILEVLRPDPRREIADEIYAQIQRMTLKDMTINNFKAFVMRLKNRQGTVLPDFEALHRQREELDRKIFRPDQ